MTTMKTAEEFKQEALKAIKDLGGFPYNSDIYWSYRAVKDIPVCKEQYFHPARGDGKSTQWMVRAYEDIKNTLGEKAAEEAKRYCERMSDLINRQEAIDYLLVNMADLIYGVPSAQPKIIRCKDCACWDTSWEPTRAKEGEHWCSAHDIYMGAEDFCSQAERRES